MKIKSGVWIRRPVMWLLIPYVLGLVLSRFLDIPPFAILVSMAVILAAGIICTIYIKLRNSSLMALMALLLLFGWFRGILAFYAINPLEPFLNRKVELFGVIDGMPQLEPGRSIYVVKAQSIEVDGKAYDASGKTRVSVYPQVYTGSSADSGQASNAFDKGIKYKPGDLIRVSGQLEEPAGRRNPKGFDYRAYLAGRGIHTIMAVKETQAAIVEPGSPWSPAVWLYSMRSRAGAVLDKAVGGEEGALLKAMLLGDRGLTPEGVDRSFKQTGLSHLLAISGLHIGFLVALMVKLSALMKLNSRWAFALQILLLSAYCLMVGFTPSITRAVVMAVIYLGGRQLGRKSDVLNSTAVAAFLILLVHPASLMEISFQLSFIAVASIALFYRPILKRLGFLPFPIASMAAVTLSAQLGTLPLTIYHFNIVSPLSLLTNLVAVPVAGLAVMISFVFIIVGSIFPIVSSVTILPLKWLVLVLIWIGEFASTLPFAYLRVVSPAPGTLAACFIALWLLSPERPSFIKKPVLTTGVAVMVILALQASVLYIVQPQELRMVFLDVGQGDCIYIKTPDNHHILLDGGGRAIGIQGGLEPGEDTVLPFLLKNGIGRLDLVIMSHGHDDHIGGLVPIVEQMPVASLMLHPPVDESEYYKTIMTAAERKGIQVYEAAKGKVYRLGDEFTLKVLFPVSDESQLDTLAGDNENNRSLVILMEYKDTAVLFTGDIEARVERFILGRLPRQADILKVAHHGSSTSSTREFLKAVSPKAGIIQVGSNIFGHPTPDTLDRLSGTGAEIYRNDEHGAVICTYHEGEWVIDTMLGH
jgi:competence protein ComEC